jgi:hypothetical protein
MKSESSRKRLANRAKKLMQSGNIQAYLSALLQLDRMQEQGDAIPS